jgi:signal transduction histidine kinase
MPDRSGWRFATPARGSTKSKGLGMGLAMCRSILESHGGSLSVERNGGSGVTFFFLLPLEPAT